MLHSKNLDYCCIDKNLFLVEDAYNYMGCTTIIGAMYFSVLNTNYFNTVLFVTLNCRISAKRLR